MRKLKRVISLHYPVSRLPLDLRGDFDPAERVTVTIEEKGPDGSEYETIVKDFSDLVHSVGLTGSTAR